MKVRKIIGSGVVIGLIYSIITIVLGVMIAYGISYSNTMTRSRIISITHLVVNYIQQNNHKAASLGIEMPNNLALLIIVSILLYVFAKKGLRIYKKMDLLYFIVAIASSISVMTMLFYIVCSLLEQANEVNGISSFFSSSIIILMRQLLLYGIILGALAFYGNRDQFRWSGYQAIITYGKYLIVTMFFFAVIVAMDLFWAVSFNGKIEGLGATIGSFSFSGNTSLFAILVIALSVGNIMGFITGITLGGELEQSYRFLRQKELNRFGLYEIFAGQLGEYSSILFIICMISLALIILIAVWRLEKSNYVRDASLLVIGILFINIAVVNGSGIDFSLQDVIGINLRISLIPILIISLLSSIVAISIRYVYLVICKKEDKDVMN